ncbi:potassium transporter TrkA [Methyloprofundus sedimenti]|uniref:Potassium transporter TrkA n=1 Tax=Methyloprofundus sedimenti TaxID=1420851 RepID=A0A1V8M2J3_9GAMM|nr:TrkA family potassium uptake protein [Methyloprofundus sedimenti]OQK15771.1 potassium transporter TrkA [Methyloprofundus sedimenti]
MAQFAVIGLGTFGAAASMQLISFGHSVMGVDINPILVNKLADTLTYAAITDASDEQALQELNIQSCDAVLVAIGSDLEASILCVLHLKNMGIKEIWAKATSKSHHAILFRLGVTRIIHPEEEMGIKVAHSLNYPMIKEFMHIGGNFYIIEIEIVGKISGISLNELLGEEKDLLKVLLLRRQKELLYTIESDFVLATNDSLILAGSLKTLQNIAPRL